MFFVPIWITNVILLVTCWLAGYQLTQIRRTSFVLNIQFLMIVFCLAMAVIVTMKNHVNPWLSMVFCLIAIVNLCVMIRQHRMLPPSKSFE